MTYNGVNIIGCVYLDVLVYQLIKKNQPILNKNKGRVGGKFVSLIDWVSHLNKFAIFPQLRLVLKALYGFILPQELPW